MKNALRSLVFWFCVSFAGVGFGATTPAGWVVSVNSNQCNCVFDVFVSGLGSGALEQAIIGYGVGTGLHTYGGMNGSFYNLDASGNIQVGTVWAGKWGSNDGVSSNTVSVIAPYLSQVVYSLQQAQTDVTALQSRATTDEASIASVAAADNALASRVTADESVVSALGSSVGSLQSSVSALTAQQTALATVNQGLAAQVAAAFPKLSIEDAQTIGVMCVGIFALVFGARQLIRVLNMGTR